MGVHRVIILLLLSLGWGISTVRAAHTQVSLVLPAKTARPGETILVGLDMKMDPDWHTYWKNPGEAGLATDIKWTLPPGVTAGPIEWPLPRKLPPAEVTTYGYKDEVMLLVPVTLAPDLKAGQSLSLHADVTWLECKEQCIPGKDSVEATLMVGSTTTPGPGAAAIASWQKQVPGPITNSPWSLQAAWEKTAAPDTRTLIITGRFSGSQDRSLTVQTAAFYPDASDNYEVEPSDAPAPSQPDVFQLRTTVKKFTGDWPHSISGVLLLGTSHGPSDYAVQTDVMDETASPAVTAAAIPLAASPALPAPSLWRMMLYAFIGGLILNIMPCVLPVIALKILGFVSEARSHPARVRLLGLVYGAGVLVSFLILAGVVIGIKAAGHQAGWGIQFGNPIFVVSLITLVLLVALNLFGLFEVSLAGGALDSASQLTLKHGFSGAFFNGVLATALATPCTAPFLGYALGFAFAQNGAVNLLIFLMVGLGLAAPYIALSWNPAWLKYLPKPGAWMEKFKIAMGFPMLLTMVWLFNLAYGNYGARVLWLGIFLVMVAFAAWIFGEFVQRGRRHRGLALGIAAVLVIGGYAYALEDQLHWRVMVTTAAAGVVQDGVDGIAWAPWSPEAVTAAQNAGRPVIVDFTADWCLTCQVNKKTSLEIPTTRARLKSLNAVALLADYTHAPDTITAELTKHGRAGVPLVLIYPATAGAPPIVLPEVLTPGIVQAALAQVSR